MTKPTPIIYDQTLAQNLFVIYDQTHAQNPFVIYDQAHAQKPFFPSESQCGLNPTRLPATVSLNSTASPPAPTLSSSPSALSLSLNSKAPFCQHRPSDDHSSPAPRPRFFRPSPSSPALSSTPARARSSLQLLGVSKQDLRFGASRDGPSWHEQGMQSLPSRITLAACP